MRSDGCAARGRGRRLEQGATVDADGPEFTNELMIGVVIGVVHRILPSIGQLPDRFSGRTEKSRFPSAAGQPGSPAPHAELALTSSRSATPGPPGERLSSDAFRPRLCGSRASVN